MPEAEEHAWMIRAIGYKLTHDSGFAPNPFHGFLTLATCKPAVRRARQKGDWVAGFASKALVQHARRRGVSIPYQGLVYLMQVTEAPMALADYFDDPRFAKKKPRVEGRRPQDRCGDNIYYRADDGQYRQLPNESHSEDDLPTDTDGVNALASTNFYYFGRNCFVPDGGWKSAIGSQLSTGRTFYCPEGFLPGTLALLQARGIRPGMHGEPCLWEHTENPRCSPPLVQQRNDRGG